MDEWIDGWMSLLHEYKQHTHTHAKRITFIFFNKNGARAKENIGFWVSLHIIYIHLNATPFFTLIHCTFLRWHSGTRWHRYYTHTSSLRTMHTLNIIWILCLLEKFLLKMLPNKYAKKTLLSLGVLFVSLNIHTTYYISTYEFINMVRFCRLSFLIVSKKKKGNIRLVWI